MMSIGLVVPTLNAGTLWRAWLDAFATQTRKPDRLLLIDSASTDGTPEFAKRYGFTVKAIDRADFNHGGTRQWALELLPDTDVVIFLTQDAVLHHPEALARLLSAFDDPLVGAAYGRQLPHTNAGPIAAHARLFNYPDASQKRILEDRNRYGIKTVFISNSFAAYRRSALVQAGGFPRLTIMNEDTFAAGKILLGGWKIAYCADARVRHSHDYTLREEFKRYFDIGVFHSRAPWLQRTFGGTSGEGWRYVRSELRYLYPHAPWLIPSALSRTVLKWLGFKLGSIHSLALPNALCRKFSLHQAYWLKVGRRKAEAADLTSGR